MAAIKSFRDLAVYRRAPAEPGEIFRLGRKFPVEEKYSLTDQIRRSSRAVNAMLAEAWTRRRYEPAFINKVNEALGEASDSEHITLATFTRRDAAWQEIGGMLQRMIDKADTFCRKPRE